MRARHRTLPVCFLGVAALFGADMGGARAQREQSAQAPPAGPHAKLSGQTSGKSASPANPAPTTPETPQTPAQIELLETHYRFEADGSSRKEVHTIVKVNSELGVRQFARLNFDYNQAFESIEIPLVRITHASGGTAEVLPSAITDAPNEAVRGSATYQDVRVKSVRILGLAPSDTLEYRVITTIAHHPLAPDFWLSHSFDRSGVVSEELFEINLPAATRVSLRVNPATAATSVDKDSSNTRHPGRDIYSWKRDARANEILKAPADGDAADVALTTFASWEALSSRLAAMLGPTRDGNGKPANSPEVAKKAEELTRDATSPQAKIAALYDFVALKIATIDLPLGATGFRTRSEAEILASSSATAEDKFKLFAALADAVHYSAIAYLAGAPAQSEKQQAYPSVFTKLLTVLGAGEKSDCCGGKVFWLDAGAEVAPFGVVASAYRGTAAFAVETTPAESSSPGRWTTVPVDLPFAALQHVTVDATLNGDGLLDAKVKYVMRGDNELLLRIAFHQSERAQWNKLAQLLSLSDGFRGDIAHVSASEPTDTHEPFTVEYEITQAKFVDWSKKPVRIPALLPLFALPDPPAKGGEAIHLGTPLEVDTRATLTLPAGFAAQTPTGTSVNREYATFASKYSAEHTSDAAKAVVLAASRHINFLVRELPANSNADYRAFLRAVQNDEAQSFTILKP